MDELLSLLLNSFHNLRVAVAGRNHGDAGCKVQETISIHIPDF